MMEVVTEVVSSKIFRIIFRKSYFWNTIYQEVVSLPFSSESQGTIYSEKRTVTRLLSQSFFRIQQVKLLRNIQRVKLKIADKRRWKFYVFLLVYAINKLNIQNTIDFNERASINGCVVFICPGRVK